MARYGRTKPPAGARLDRGHPLAQGLVFCVPCTEGGGLPRDYASGIVPTATGTHPWSVGPLGAQATNTTDIPAYDYGNIPAVQAAARVTAAVWATPANTSRSDWLNHFQSGVSLHFWLASGLSPAKAQFSVSVDGTTGPSATGVTSYAAGALHLFCGTFDGASIKVYLDGVLDGTTAQSGLLTTSATPNVRLLGSYNTAANGAVAAAYIWNRALSASEVQWLYAEPFAMFRPPAPPAWRRTTRFDACALSAALAPSGGLTRAATRRLAGSLAPSGGLGAADLLYLQRAFATRRSRALLSPQTAVTLRSGDVSVPFLFDLSAALGSGDSISSASVSIYAYPHPSSASVPAGTDVTASILRSSTVVAGSGVLLLLGNANAVPGTRYRAIIVATCASGEHIQESIEHIICDQ